MNKELNFEANNCVEEAVEICEISENLGGKSIGKKIGVGLCVAAITTAVVVIARKHKGALTNLAVKKLKKKGYTVCPPLEDLDCGEKDSSEVKSENN